MYDKIKGGILGAIIGDALGVPVEFYKREILKARPVVDMRDGGSHKERAGTWSDDSSMILCTVESLTRGLDYEDIGNNFYKWIKDAYLTPYEKVFGVGRATLYSIGAISKGKKAIEAGQSEEKYNGNGSLMRIIPIAFYIKKNKIEDWYGIVRNLSSITHKHEVSCNACILYVQYVLFLLAGMDKSDAYFSLREDKNILKLINTKYHDEFERIINIDISEVEEDSIKTSGYVIETLEAALWCFLNTSNYKECVLKAVNLGGDTDTIASIAGGLAGVYYGSNDLPNEWLEVIARKSDILELIEEFNIKI